MNDEQFDKIVELLTDIKDGIDNLTEAEIVNQKSLADIRKLVNSIDLSIITSSGK